MGEANSPAMFEQRIGQNTQGGYYSKSPYFLDKNTTPNTTIKLTKPVAGNPYKKKANGQFEKDQYGKEIANTTTQTFVPLSQFSPISNGGGPAQQYAEVGTEVGDALIREDDARVAKDADLQSGKTLELVKKRNAQLEKKNNQDAVSQPRAKKKQATGTMLTDQTVVGSVLGGPSLLGG